MEHLASALDAARSATLELVEDLSDMGLRTQYDPDFSPIGWHLGHIAWVKECWLLRALGGQAPIDPDREELWNSFASVKNTRGARLPSRRALFDYERAVHERALGFLAHAELEASEQGLLRFINNHERQHTEIISTVRLLGGLHLGGRARPDRAREGRVSEGGYVKVPAGEFVLGDDDDPDGWDNERSAHRVFVAEFRIGVAPVSAGAWLEFMAEGGYDDPRLWSEEGYRWRALHDVQAPLHWSRDARGVWRRRTLRGEELVEADRPVSHVSHYEACAFASFYGARLPTEAEWEKAASFDAANGHKRRFAWGDALPSAAEANLGLAEADVAPSGSHSRGRAACGAEDMIGTVWEWCASVFSPYPGFVPQAYRGYSEPWFDGRHWVARGGSYASAPEIARCCFRNWYTPDQRQPALGLRLAEKR
jgi:iron(II)-dependent oxidoreductase